MRVEPLKDNIYLKEIEVENKSTIIITDESNDDLHILCKVEAVGSDVTSVDVGDTVLISKYEGITVWCWSYSKGTCYLCKDA